MPSQRITIRLSAVMAARLAARVGPHGQVADTVRQAIEAYLDDDPPKRQPRRPLVADAADTAAATMAAIQTRLATVEQRLTALEATAASGRPAASQRQTPPLTPQDASQSEDYPPFDATRYRLGKLCPQGHAYAGTGMSLLRRSNQHCRECANAQKREKRAAQRQG